MPSFTSGFHRPICQRLDSGALAPMCELTVHWAHQIVTACGKTRYGVCTCIRDFFAESENVQSTVSGGLAAQHHTRAPFVRTACA
jgi:hypothetical protein